MSWSTRDDLADEEGNLRPGAVHRPAAPWGRRQGSPPNPGCSVLLVLLGLAALVAGAHAGVHWVGP